jgi:TatD DNase family protein
MLIDSHCHLDFDDLNNDLDGVLARAADAGISEMVTISTKMTTFDRVRAIAETHDNIYCTVGVHPHESEKEGDVSTERLIELSGHARVIGIGETGLDYYYEHAPRDAQKASFRRHIDASRQTGLPLIIHTRDADDDMAQILKDEMGKGAFPGLLHCFSSGSPLAKTGIELGLYVSFSGIVTFKAAEDVRQAARLTPFDRLLVETDAPYLAPVPKRGKTNEPSFVAHTAARLAEVKDVTPEEMAIITTDNFYRLFTKATRPA